LDKKISRDDRSRIGQRNESSTEEEKKMKTKIKSIFIMSISLAIVLSACGGNLNKGKGQNANMANPASVYCEEQGYQLEMREDENGQYGVCIFPDGSECDEWAYFRGECGPSEKGEQSLNMANPASVYCEEQGYQLEMREDENGQYGVCIFPDGSECDEWAYFRGECAPGDPESKEQASDFTPFSMQVVAIYGSVISSNTEYPSSSKLIIMPEGFGSVYITGATGELEEQILSLRNKPMPSNKANFWGELDCPALDSCLLTVSQMRVDGPGSLPPADQVDGWEGVLYSGPPGPRSGGDDYFAMLGQMPFQYGIEGLNETIQQQLESLRDSGKAFKIWGELYAGRMDWNAAQIIVSRLELIEADPALIPPAPTW
jgi:hypothetical protein